MKRFAPAASLIILLPVLFSTACGGGGSTSSSIPTSTTEALAITTASTIQCIQTVPFSLTLQAQGASSAVTWKILSGQLPSGLALDSASGVISGTPLANPTSLPTIQASDAKASASRLFNFEVFSRLVINSVSPVAGHLSAPYSISISARGPTVDVWSISSGQLPPGMAFNLNPLNTNFTSVSGIPTQVGTFSFTVQAQTTNPSLPLQTDAANITIAVDSHLAISKSTLKNGGQNLPYSDFFAVVNGTPPYHWTIAGNFPAGLALDATSGVVSGTPTDLGRFFYSVSVTDSSSPVQSDSAQGFLDMAQQLQIAGTFSDGFIGLNYNQVITAFGGTPPYSWTIASGTLPPGLSLSSFGFMTGTPTQLGVYNFVLRVTDSGSPPYVVALPTTIKITPPPLLDFAPPLSPAPVNVVYHSQIAASGGTPPYTWSIAFGQLPLGLALDAVTGFIDGTPTQIGTYNFGARVTDSGNPPQAATANDFIQIRRPLGRNDSIATATPLGNSGAANPPTFSISPYIDPINAPVANPDTDFYKLVAIGGSLVHVETVAGRAFGLDPLDSVIELLNASSQRLQSCASPSFASVCLNDDIDSTTTDSALDLKVPGPPTSQTTFYVHVFDWRGDARPDMQYYLNVSGVVQPLTISTNLGPGATRGVPYSQQLSTQGGTGAVTWSLGGGALPSGWFLNPSGLISGTATTNGFYSFTIQAADSANPPQSASAQYTLQIADPVVIISPATLPSACLNQPYSFTLQTNGGLPPVLFTASGFNWPLTGFNQTTGTISGTPLNLGIFTLGVGAVDSAQPPSTVGQNISLTVVACH